MTSRQRQQHGRRMQRRSSDESYSSATSSSKTHRRSSSFNGNGLSSLGSESPGSGSDTSMKASATKAKHPRSASWSSGISALFRSDMTDCSPESKMIRRTTLGDGEDNTFCAFELIRQLSFSPTQKTKKRTNTAETEPSSSFDSSDTHHPKQNTSPIGLDLDLDLDFAQHDLRRSPSPLLGLKYI
ncbi:hypothetical protein QTG54_013365 [Skeletonema marinoi]|uniref:Uncharacterized protein n=1 Tax=Skeletonema marinoi TaxID=267567 RepID=A0AAD8XYR7_9STRA|nr:hypothetical protein QTG54_013365 [Skeletonema marinoi]